MLKSMTGYGTASFENEKYSINVEIKSLNSKFLDCNTRIPRSFSDKEIEIRNILGKQLERGKVNFSIDFQVLENKEAKVTFNEDLVQVYYQTLVASAEKVGASTDGLLLKVLDLPQVIESNNSSKASDDEWKLVLETIQKAIDNCNEFRGQEGASLMQKLASYINTIQEELNHIIAHDSSRIENIRKRIKDKLDEVVSSDNFDENRYEQELIYYIEKLDITEEKVRLQNHLTYFLENLESAQNSGKKLNFISQEIGREINTIGSKANDATLQKHVVVMKEELEKIKEQTLNIL
ncbi:MAG: YicC family protein [Cytophagales bacterium]|nr:YicC family protein [Cytophagales bacterium]